ncbi:rhamnulose-1-phosphate aldolase [Spirochaetia bacterium]|nr:rhamnulose-1-phosphate aldolase [Spirochaetia bacterium]
MSDILKAPIMAELIRTCSNMYSLGWNERNGGNISIIVDEEEISRCPDIKTPLGDFDLNCEVPTLGGKVFAVTRTGSYFKNVEINPEYNLGIIKISEDGKRGSLLWGFSDGGKPTSELPTHLRCHAVRLGKDKNHRVVTHCHATNTLAMTFVHELDDKSFTHSLWQMITECIIVFPDGVGVLPWMICGNDEIGRATAKKMEDYRICIWGQHGIFATGNNLDEAFGLIETVEKAAEIYIKIMNRPILNTIQDHELKSVAETFGLPYRKDFL